MALLLGLVLSWSAEARAGQSSLEQFLGQVSAGDVVPGADRFGPIQEEPAMAPAYKGDDIVGYVFLNSDHANSTGYSGKPIQIMVGLDKDGTIVGLKLVKHSEPIVLVGIPQQRVEDYLKSFIGFNPIRAAAENSGPPKADIVSGATVTVLVAGESIMQSAFRVSRALGLGGFASASEATGGKRAIDMNAGELADWQTLIGEGSVRRLHLSVGDVNQAFERSGNRAAAARPAKGAPEDTFIDLYAAVVSQPAIGKSLLGEAEFANLQRLLVPGQHAVLIAGEGAYSFKGSGYVRGGIFDRIELVQGAETIRFRDRHDRRVGSIKAAGVPKLKEMDVFIIPEGVEFDPAEPWQLQLLVQRATGPLDKAFVSFDLSYQLPARYTVAISPAPEAASGSRATAAPVANAEAAQPATESTDEVPLWQRIWQSRIAAIAMLIAMLITLTAIFFFQDVLVKREVLFDRIRLGFLAVTLVWLGWTAQAQLSVVNVLTFVNALRADFQWSNFLLDPLIFILWFAVAAALLFWGRGPFCGWLCPFGALQELANRAAKALKVPQLKIPWPVHERLWPMKYIIFLVLFGVSLGSLAYAEALAEIEPFKTAIILRFMRDWWFVALAAALLLPGLFVERFFCRYLCPLGAALAIPGRMRMFDWLKRYRECGNPCRRCFNECPVEAIHPEGHINPNECISCLHCQVLYRHESKCPVLIQRRVKREKRLALSQPASHPGQPRPESATASKAARSQEGGLAGMPTN